MIFRHTFYIPRSSKILFQMLVPKPSAFTLIRTLATPPPPRLGVELGHLLSYCANHSTPLHPALRDLQEFTLARGNSRMMAAPEVLALNSLLIQVHIKPKR